MIFSFDKVYIENYFTGKMPHETLPTTVAPRTAAPRRPTWLNYLHSLIAIPLIYLYTIVLGSISLVLSFFDPAGRRQHWCARLWCRCRLIARTAGARVRVHGAEHIEPGVSYVFLSTH